LVWTGRLASERPIDRLTSSVRQRRMILPKAARCRGSSIDFGLNNRIKIFCRSFPFPSAQWKHEPSPERRSFPSPRSLAPWSLGPLVPGPLVPWSLVPWSLGPWSLGPLVPWSLVPWSLGPLVPWSLGPWSLGPLVPGPLVPQSLFPWSLVPWSLVPQSLVLCSRAHP
jgi:hypothetical protein